MAKNPILPLYYNDILGSTKTWTDEEFGAYLRLLIEQWDKGGLPKDYQRLTRLATSLSTNWAMLKDKFPEVDGMLKNPVMEGIREKRARYGVLQSDRVRKRYQTSTEPPTKNVPVENEYENENEKVIEVRKGVEGETIDAQLNAALDSRTIEEIKVNARMAYPGVDIDREVQRFRMKVIGSPSVYKDHDTGGLRLALHSHLRFAKGDPTPKGARPKAFEI